MDKITLERLSKNPHYKMTTKQKAEFELFNRKPMIQFGAPDIEKNEFAKHNTNMVKIKYENKKESKSVLDK